MLTIIVPGKEHFNEETSEFITVGDVVLELEHSLVTLSKWEAIYEKPFLSQVTKTPEETFAYIELMVLTPDLPPEVLHNLSEANMLEINGYLNAKMTATWFSDLDDRKTSSEVITSELIYYWMMSLQIDLECEHWHLNRLFTLLRIFSAKNSGKKEKENPQQTAQRYREMNARRRAELGTTG